MRKQIFLTLSCMLLLSACTSVGPNYKKPALNLASNYINGSNTSTNDITTEQWWLKLKDKPLNELVAIGMEQNLDVRTSIERINSANAVVRANGHITQLSGNASGSLTRSGKSGTGINSGAITARSLAGNASYAFDLFGRNRRAQEQSKARYESTVFDTGAARLALLSELIESYVNARFYQESIALTRRAISSRRETLELTRRQQTTGTLTSLDEANAEALLNQAIARLPELETGFYTSVFGIATLIDEPVSSWLKELERGAPQPRPSGENDYGIPADTLRNRPDVNSTERQFAAAVAAVGIATADLYPSLSLDGNIGVSADITSWSFGPMLNLPILNQTKLRAVRDRQISLAKQAELVWRKSVTTAVNEVQTNMDAYKRLRREVYARQKAATSYQKVLTLSKETYTVGSTSLLDLLEAERFNDNAQLSLASSKQQLTNSWVRLQIASGKGWK